MMKHRILSLIALLCSALQFTAAERVCNGLASNCNHSANEIMYASVHDAMSSKDDGFLFPNNFKPIEEALIAGFRGFLLDSCDCNGEIVFCHSFCILGQRETSTVFTAFATFLKKNPFEVIILELQINDNSLAGLWESTTDDFRDLLYSHTNVAAKWPTLDELIGMDKRIIVFQHNGGDCDVADNCPVGVHETWTYAFETDWELTGADEVLDFDKSCEVRTGQSNNAFLLSNHFAGRGVLRVPSVDIANEINTLKVLQDRLDACTERIGRRTNLLVVDFWSIGEVLQFVNSSNLELSSPGGAPGPSPSPTPAGGGGDGGGGFDCFSGDTTVEIQNRGAVNMRDLSLGDQVLVSLEGNKYEPVYSFGHLDKSTPTNYLQFHPSNLEMTRNHMVFVEGEGAIPASRVRVGDVLEGGIEVMAIRNVARRGMYAPFTPSGKIVVNGVVASNYISFDDSPVFNVGSLETPLSYQWLAHSFQLPHRIWCYYLGSCTEEHYTETGLSTWVDRSFRAALWFKGQHDLVVGLLLVPLVFCAGALTLVEMITVRPILAIALLCIYVGSLNLRIKRKPHY